MNHLNKALQVIQGAFSTQASNEAAGGKPTDLPKDTVAKSFIHILSPSACWTTTVATTVPPDEQ